MTANVGLGGSTASTEGDVVAQLLQELLRRTHFTTPSELPAVVAEQIEPLGASDVALYLIDLEQAALMPLPTTRAAEQLEPLSVTGTVAGRAFSSTTIRRAPADQAGRQRRWVPLVDGTDRVGVLGLSFVDEVLTEALVATCERFAHLVAMLIVTKSAYGDMFEQIRRRRPMTIASELLWALAPPLMFATDDLVLGGLLEPCYDNGGDALDYAINDRVLHLGVFDAMGHGLAAAGVAAFALSAYRHSRRAGADLAATYASMHDAVGRQFPDDRFVTAVIAQLELDTGRLTWISAGHPPPVVIRDRRRTRSLHGIAAPPLGVEIPVREASVSEESLEPGDLLLFYTDGLTEARDPDGAMFTLDRLSAFIEREAAAGQTAPETLRRLRHAILGRERAELRDDATALLVEWRSGGEAALMPQTVL